MINLTIDGKPVEVADGTTVLEAARQAGIHIPTLCDHPELTPYGGCRLCLVEIEGARTFQASCTLPASNKMVIRTDTPKLKEARKFILTLLFSERNHFCPFCQMSGGDCELQNAAYAEGMTHWPISPSYNPFPVDATHKYFVLDNNRCILCRRCVRACAEMSGNFTLGVEERGAHTMIIADFGLPLGSSSCISCGSCLQVCPTGSLIDRWASYRGHEVQMEQVKTVCVGCSIGCGLTVWVRDNQIVKIDGDWDSKINQGVLCEVGRFLPMVENRQRITHPLVRQGEEQLAATWDQAIEIVAQQLKPSVNHHKPIAAIASTRLTAEALFTFKQIFADCLKCKTVTSIEEGKPTRIPAKISEELGHPFESTLDAIKESDCAVIVGANLMDYHEVASFFFKRNTVNGTRIIVIDPEANNLDMIANIAIKEPATPALFKSLSKGSSQDETIAAAANMIAAAKNPVFIYGKGVSGQNNDASLKAMIQYAQEHHGKLISVKGEANSVVASRFSLEGDFSLDGEQAVFVALGDLEPSPRLLKRLEDVPFLVVQASYESELTRKADVVLPVEMWAEQSGHYLNLDGQLQEGFRCLTPTGEVRSNIEVLQSVAKALNIPVSDDWQSELSRRTPITLLS